MKTIALSMSLLFISGILCGQSTSIRVKAGENVMEVLANEIFYYPVFKDGLVRFKQGEMQNAKFNYNTLMGEMQFLNPQGDTLALADEKTVDYIAIGTDTFRYDKGYFNQLESTGTIKLAVKRRLKLLDKQKIGGYDMPSSTGAVTSFSSYYNFVQSFKLNVREDVLFSKDIDYFFGDKYNHFQPAGKKNVYELFPSKKPVIEKYLKENDVDFKKEDDLRKLITFLKDV